MEEVGARTYFSVMTLMIGSWRDFMRFYSFFDHISSKLPRGEGDGNLIWQLTCSGVFDMHSFYNSLLEAPSISFP